MTDADLSVILAEKRAAIREAEPVPDLDVMTWRAGLAAGAGQSLLAALDAALNLADELEHLQTAPPSGKEDEAAALGLRWFASKVREAIAAALTGTPQPSEDENHG